LLVAVLFYIYGGNDMSSTIFTIGLFSAVVSLIGTLLGALVGITIKNPSRKVLGGILGIASGIMISIIFLELIPESVEKTNFFITLIAILIGIVVIAVTDYLSKGKRWASNSHKKVAFLMALGLMLHNFPEGIIMGFGFIKEANLGIKMSLLISIHDMPEGIAIAAPLIASGVRPLKILWYAFLVALPTAIGAWMGILIGTISQAFLGYCLAFASGVMLYVVFGQMIPESNELSDGYTNTITILMGVVFGFVMINVI
jgi:zinc transporter, ZIP family